MLEITHVTKRYGMKTAVGDVSLRVEAGRLVALLGPNGSGKTTLMKMIAGLTCPTSGEIVFDGETVGTGTKRHVAYMPTEAYFYNYMTARDAGRYYRDFFEDFSMERYMRLLDEEHLDAGAKIRAMSSGMVAKVKLALTFARDSRLTMLDEPLNGIDIIARERTISLIRAHHTSQRALIVSSHLVEELEDLIDDAVFMLDGSVALSGTKQHIREQYGAGIVEMYRRIYGESEGNGNV
ncbi:MAG TPA: ABC transporter ATP-binding protein [Candidatus Pullichristensenella avicola]|nr:ABC transporter ATP-binding protein [Candidatus Pullichristensenella avicola]